MRKKEVTLGKDGRITGRVRYVTRSRKFFPTIDISVDAKAVLDRVKDEYGVSLRAAATILIEKYAKREWPAIKAKKS